MACSCSGDAYIGGNYPSDESGGASGIPFGEGGTSGTGSAFSGSRTRRLGEESCVAELAEAESAPLAIHILFDQSGSMSTPTRAGSRLDAVRAATSDFLRAPTSAGLGVGIGYFGHMPLGQTSCDPARYETPAVQIGKLPDRAEALLASLGGIEPVGETPTGAAIRGACSYVEAWTKENPGHNPSILVLTDGVPEAPMSRENGCDPTLEDAIEATRACVDSTGVRVHVLGVGPNLDNLNRIARAGGTERAYLVESDSVSEDVLAALAAIRGSVLPCEFFIPDPPAGRTLNLAEVNVIVTDNGGEQHDVFNVQGPEACDPDAGGWYYEPRDAPERIELCEATCDYTRSQSKAGAIEYALGCGTIALR